MSDNEVDNNDQKVSGKESSLDTKAHDLLVRGRSLNSGENFNQEAFDLLSKAIKLNPFLIEAWIELTNCYQKKPDIDGAISCLENALKYCDTNNPNKIILRKLSTCIRQKTCDSQETKIAALLKSLDLSKQALRSDLYDEENYYNLAKAYMCLFFATECVDQQLINLSRAAFMKSLTLSNNNINQKNRGHCGEDQSAIEQGPAVSDHSTRSFIEQSDFLFNYSTVLVYLQDFQKALEYLRLAIDLDPKWSEPKILEECIVDYIRQIKSMMNELGKNNKKVVRRYSKVIETLKSVDKIENIIELDQRRLQKSVDIKIKSLTLDQLEANLNSKEIADVTINRVVKILHLKLVNTINYNQAMYLTFIAIDQNYSLIVVTIYNLAASRCPTPRDVVTIVEPKIEKISIDESSREGSDGFNYNRINVREFKDFYVNGFRITTDQVSKPQFKVSVMP